MNQFMPDEKAPVSPECATARQAAWDALTPEQQAAAMSESAAEVADWLVKQQLADFDPTDPAERREAQKIQTELDAMAKAMEPENPSIPPSQN